MAALPRHGFKLAQRSYFHCTQAKSPAPRSTASVRPRVGRTFLRLRSGQALSDAFDFDLPCATRREINSAKRTGRSGSAGPSIKQSKVHGAWESPAERATPAQHRLRCRPLKVSEAHVLRECVTGLVDGLALVTR